MNNANVVNPNDFKVVSFHNSTNFGFTPEMGCMFDGRGINGKNGSPGIDAGETVILPYHIGHQLALNLAKIAILKTAPSVDAAGIPTGVPLWDIGRLNNLKMSYLKELYTEDKPVAMTETDKLMARVEEYKKTVDALLASTKNEAPIAPTVPTTASGSVYKDKLEVITELEVRGIKFDRRLNKAALEKLLV